MERVIAAQVNKNWRTTRHVKQSLWEQASIIIPKVPRQGKLDLQLQFYRTRTRTRIADQRRSADIQGILELSIHVKEASNPFEVQTIDTIVALLLKEDSLLHSLRSLPLSNTSRPTCLGVLQALSRSPRTHLELRDLRVAGECVDSGLFSMCFERFHTRLETLILLCNPVSGTEDKDWPSTIPAHLSTVRKIKAPCRGAYRYKRPRWKLVVEARVSMGMVATKSTRDYSPLGLSICRMEFVERLYTLHIGGDLLLSKCFTSGDLVNLRVLKLDNAILRSTNFKVTNEMLEAGTEIGKAVQRPHKLPALEQLHITHSSPRISGRLQESISPGSHLGKLEAPKLAYLFIGNEGSIDDDGRYRHYWGSYNTWAEFCGTAKGLKELRLVKTSDPELVRGLAKLRSLEVIAVSGIKLPKDFISTAGKLSNLQCLAISDCTDIDVSSVLELARSKGRSQHPLRIEIGDCPSLSAEDVAKLEAELGPLKRA